MVLLFSLVLLFNSCIMEDNNGFPKHVTFDAGGSTQIITGEISPGLINLFDGSNIKGTLYWEHDEVQYGWLKVRFIYSKHQIVLTASHNESKQKRSYRLYLDFGREYGNVTVTQKGK